LLLAHAGQKLKHFSIGIINAAGLLITSNVDCEIYFNCCCEIAVPATKLFILDFKCYWLLNLVKRLSINFYHFYYSLSSFVFSNAITETS